MTDEQAALKKKIAELKEHWKLIPDRGHQFDTGHFTLLNVGDWFSVSYKWQCPEISADTLIIAYNNSYRVNVVKAEREYSPELKVSRYLCCYTVFEHDFPDFIIRPNSLANWLTRMFFNDQLRVETASRFNRKYILESNDKNNIVNRLGETLFTLVSDTHKVYIEVRDNHCLIFFLEPAWVNTSYLKMLEIAKELTLCNAIISKNS